MVSSNNTKLIQFKVSAYVDDIILTLQTNFDQ